MQSVVNLGGITGLFPLTGTPFPFVSFGGSSLMVNLIAIGILLNVSIFNKIRHSPFKIYCTIVILLHLERLYRLS